MRYHALAVDYDGTLATHGQVDDPTIQTLERFRQSGRKLILVTGRELEELKSAFPRFEIFDQIVAENGALLYQPNNHQQVSLGPRSSDDFINELKRRGVSPIHVGQVIIATWQPHETTVLQVIRDMGLELQVIFNKSAVMILPSGINKATGLQRAADALNLSLHNIVGMGDAENDHAFLDKCEFAAAVENALPSVKDRADWTSPSPHGQGVCELIDHMLTSDLKEIPLKTPPTFLLGEDRNGNAVTLPAYGIGILLAGTSGGGKTTFATRLIEEMSAAEYQFCILDPEGDYQSAAGDAVMLGNNHQAPSIDEIADLLSKPDRSCVINLLGISLEDRPLFFEKLLPRLQSLRASTGRPHWILIDETHHLLPAEWGTPAQTIPQSLSGFILITVHPHHVAKEILSMVDLIIAIGQHPDETIRTFSETLGEKAPPVSADPLQHGEAYLWSRRPLADPVWIRSKPPKTERIRHLRKYAQGEIPEKDSFYFRGRDGKINLRAQNLKIFLQIADGIDDETWLFHLKQGDYSHWFRTIIKDEVLATEAEQIEKSVSPDPKETRHLIRSKIEEKYTAPP